MGENGDEHMGKALKPGGPGFESHSSSFKKKKLLSLDLDSLGTWDTGDAQSGTEWRGSSRHAEAKLLVQ